MTNIPVQVLTNSLKDFPATALVVAWNPVSKQVEFQNIGGVLPQGSIDGSVAVWDNTNKTIKYVNNWIYNATNDIIASNPLRNFDITASGEVVLQSLGAARNNFIFMQNGNCAFESDSPDGSRYYFKPNAVNNGGGFILMDVEDSGGATIKRQIFLSSTSWTVNDVKNSNRGLAYTFATQQFSFNCLTVEFGSLSSLVSPKMSTVANQLFLSQNGGAALAIVTGDSAVQGAVVVTDSIIISVNGSRFQIPVLPL